MQRSQQLLDLRLVKADSSRYGGCSHLLPDRQARRNRSRPSAEGLQSGAPPLGQIHAHIDRITAELKVMKAFLEGSNWLTAAVNKPLEAWIEQFRFPKSSLGHRESEGHCHRWDGWPGKTTLAQLVYNDDAVKAYFESSRMWTVGGDEFDAANIMNSVLQQDTGKPDKISEIELVRKKIENAFSGKKFLLVMDDVWNEAYLSLLLVTKLAHAHLLSFRFLQKLDLRSMAEITLMVAEFHGHGGFPSLQELSLDKMDNLEEWSKSHDVDELFPKLQSLKISGCPKLKSMPRLLTVNK
ncbi:hypothetical protein ZIOFF_072471 [Zingiber officinale]|uniref:NB-ARC domain-containing protein n=1 Tax=Zingiber officinale TaxID=94328 RepID=A0A8J5BYV4_ZINOF|nr:hypothetical protein ZIOFF_072471 [Zingiber officinale]